jgi:hypothetical protein
MGLYSSVNRGIYRHVAKARKGEVSSIFQYIHQLGVTFYIPR